MINVSQHRSPPLSLYSAALLLFILICAIVGLSHRRPSANRPQAADLASQSITADDLLRHIQTLASDKFEGRAPATRGEELTLAYLTEQFKRLGLTAGNPDGTYLQKVPLVGFRSEPVLHFQAGGKRLDFRFPDEYVAVPSNFTPAIRLDSSEVIFVGYGIVAPEKGRDDYGEADVRGKTVLILSGEAPANGTRQSEASNGTTNRGRQRAFYGTPMHKYAAAARKGAAAAILIHEGETTGVTFENFVGEALRERFDIRPASVGESHVRVESQVHVEPQVRVESVMSRVAAGRLLSAAKVDFEVLKQRASSPRFRPLRLVVKATFHLKNPYRTIDTHNFIARLEGSAPRLKDELIIYTAHWDHFGRAANRVGDQIFNGAVDNAAGVAALLEIAEAFKKLPSGTSRSVLFLVTTSEEAGMLGAKYYVEHPLYPLSRTLAAINLDTLNPFGRTREIGTAGYGYTNLEELFREEVVAQGRNFLVDAGSFSFTSDHFQFAQAGVPVLYTGAVWSGYVDKPARYGAQRLEEYLKRDYHQPSDEVKPDWDMSGAAEDVQLFFRVGYRIARGDLYPAWKEGLEAPFSEFKKRRAAMLASPATDARR